MNKDQIEIKIQTELVEKLKEVAHNVRQNYYALERILNDALEKIETVEGYLDALEEPPEIVLTVLELLTANCKFEMEKLSDDKKDTWLPLGFKEALQKKYSETEESTQG